MTDITKHIITLLERNREVTLPDLGGLYLSKTATLYHYDNTTFYPSNVSVTFNPHRLLNDGSLRNEIAISENMSSQQAEHELQKFITKVKQELSKNQECVLPRIGQLVSDQMGNIILKTADDFILNKNNYGLSPIVSRPEEPQKGAFAVEKKISAITTVNKQKKSIRKWLLISAIVIIVISLLLLLAVLYYHLEYNEIINLIKNKLR